MTTINNIPTFDGYGADANGNIYTQWLNGSRPLRKTGVWKVLKPSIQKNGYLRVAIFRDGKRFTRSVHQLVCEAFHGLRPDGRICCHNNGIKSDCRSENVRWGTYLDNSADQMKHGTTLRGERNPQSKLTEPQALEIKLSKEPSSVFKRKYGVSRSLVCAIRHGLTWTYMDLAGAKGRLATHT